MCTETHGRQEVENYIYLVYTSNYTCGCIVRIKRTYKYLPIHADHNFRYVYMYMYVADLNMHNVYIGCV